MNFRKNISNLFGWNTKRKIIVIESDDWGSIRTKNKDAYIKMLEGGLDVDKSNFTRYDSLESNEDLRHLFNVLKNHNDASGRHPVFTPMCVIVNPDFEKIKETNFTQYFYEPFTETCKKYSDHDQVYALWLKGIDERLFVPQLHGREHLNVSRWLKALKVNNKGLELAFQYESIGASYYKGEKIPEHLAAFNPEYPDDIAGLEDIILDAGLIFENLLGYKPQYFIASNSSEPKVLEATLKRIGVKYLTRYKIQKYPLGNGKFQRQFNWLGKINKYGQIYLTRNVGFEPSESNERDVVQTCLKDIEIAFKWKKPAVISTHRVNYIGCIEESNRENGLNALNELLKNIINKWPDVEFMTSAELGELIWESKKKYGESHSN